MRKRSGVTLVELILVVAIVGIVMAALVPYIRNIHRTWEYGDRRTEMLQHARVSMDKMVKVIRATKGIKDIDSSGQGNYIGLSDESGASLLFFHNVSSSPYYIGETGNIKDNDLVMQTEETDRQGRVTIVNSLFAKSLESLTFTYLKETMDEADLATSTGEVQAVKVEMALSDPEGKLSGTLPVSSLAYRRMPPAGREGGVWVSDTFSNRVVKLDLNGNELLSISGFRDPRSISANSTDGSCWVKHSPGGYSQLVKLDSNGTELVRVPSVPYDWSYWNLSSISVNSTDGSLWVAAYGTGQVVKFDSNGTELVRVSGFNSPWSVSVNSTDGSCWVADTHNNRIVKLSSDGGVLLSLVGVYPNVYTATMVSVNSTDGSCWLLVSPTHSVIKLDSNGSLLVSVAGFSSHQSISVNSTDGSLWVADTYSYTRKGVVKLDSNGVVLEKIGGFVRPWAVSVNSTDGSCWVGTDRSFLVKLNSSGRELVRIGGFNFEWVRDAISVDTGERK